MEFERQRLDVDPSGEMGVYYPGMGGDDDYDPGPGGLD
jgi:hypothetical protein